MGKYHRVRIPIPGDYPPSFLVREHLLPGSEVHADGEDQVLATVEDVAIESHGPQGPNFLQVGLKAAPGHSFRADDPPFGMRVAFLDPAGEPGEPQKWYVERIERMAG